MGSLLTLGVKGGNVVALHDATGGEEIFLAVIGDNHIFVEGARHAVGIAFGDKAVTLDATADEVVNHRLCTALAEGVVGEAYIGLAVGVRAYLNHNVGVVLHDEIEIHEGVHEFALKLGLGQVEAYLGQYDGAHRHRLHAEVVHQRLVCGVALGALRALYAEVVFLGEIHLVDHIAAHKRAIELVVAFLIGAGLELAAVGAHSLDAHSLEELHGLLATYSALYGIVEAGQHKVEDIVVDGWRLLLGLVGELTVVRVGEWAVGREVAALHDGGGRHLFGIKHY